MKRTIHRNANTVRIDGDRFRAWAYQNRLSLMAVGPLIGKSANLASVWCYRGHASYWTLDALAFELGVDTNALIAEIGTPEELQRVSA
jgi:hypothetical protein